jgi:hypothetical protein
MPVTSSYQFPTGGGGDYTDPANRGFAIVVQFDEGNTATLPERMDEAFQKALIFHLGEAAQKVIDTARHYLVRLEEPAVKNEIHGYDTGLMYVSLRADLMESLLATGVFYELLSDEAKYWRWVEFGHWMINGQFWEGYHFLETAIEENAAFIRQRVREAWADTAILMARESKVGGLLGHLGIG